MQPTSRDTARSNELNNDQADVQISSRPIKEDFEKTKSLSLDSSKKVNSRTPKTTKQNTAISSGAVDLVVNDGSDEDNVAVANISKHEHSEQKRKKTFEENERLDTEQIMFTTDVNLVEIKQNKVRSHGFQRPFSFLQVLSWILTAFIGISFIMIDIILFTRNADLLNEPTQNDTVIAILTGLYGLSLLFLILQTIQVTYSDPTDPTIKLYKLHKQTLAQYNDKKTNQFVQFNQGQFNFECTVCDSYVLDTSKHC